jgi:hypothetical protein
LIFEKDQKNTIGSIAKLSGQFDFCPKLIFWIELNWRNIMDLQGFWTQYQP